MIFFNVLKETRMYALILRKYSRTVVDFKKCYQILEISEGSDQEQIRAAYIRLAKIYHPDSGSDYADANKFHEVDSAFRALILKKSQERWQVEDNEVYHEDDDKHMQHATPQHRQYLSFEGIGFGTPFQRQKQYSSARAMQAAQNVLQHRVSKVVADEKTLMAKKPLKHKIKTRYGFDRLVEDLIQEAMSKGEFNNLSGSGKPLQHQYGNNPYVDFTTHKINQVLIDNGFTPEWITLQKEIREELKILRDSLLTERTYFGPSPLKENEVPKWSQVLQKHRKLVDQINAKINKYNLIVPILDKQMFLINLDKESEKAVAEGKNNLEVDHSAAKDAESEAALDSINSINLFGLIGSLFKGKG